MTVRTGRMLAAGFASAVLIHTTIYAEAATAQSLRRWFAPTADARVKSASPTQNFGARMSLGADALPVIRSYIRFEVKGLNGRVVRARLRFSTLTGSTSGIRVHPVSNVDWDEYRITFRNAPSFGAVIDASKPFVAGERIKLDVTERIRGNGTFAFAMTTRSATLMRLGSREAQTALEPRLVIDTVVPELEEGADPVLVGAGDIAACNSNGDEQTAALLDWIAGDVFTVGDNVYPNGSEASFATCFDTSWGRHKARTRPTPGNHDYRTAGAAPYFGYFGTNAGDPATGYYSYDVGAWHVIAINSNCAEIGGCEAGSPQEQWLRADLAASAAACSLAYWHHPLFSSGALGQPEMAAIWQALYEHGADVVLSGHDHHYERFAPQTPIGEADPVNGIREFIVGTGGKSHTEAGTPIANSEVYDDDTFGVLKLTLHASSYNWQFVPVEGATFTDSGSSSCH